MKLINLYIKPEVYPKIFILDKIIVIKIYTAFYDIILGNINLVKLVIICLREL